jgi:hypothetical protein
VSRAQRRAELIATTTDANTMVALSNIATIPTVTTIRGAGARVSYLVAANLTDAPGRGLAVRGVVVRDVDGDRAPDITLVRRRTPQRARATWKPSAGRPAGAAASIARRSRQVTPSREARSRRGPPEAIVRTEQRSGRICSREPFPSV